MANHKPRALRLEEHRAIREYGNTYGRTWKAAVRELWMRATAHDDTEALVYALRNSHGPRWLQRFTMADARKAVFLAESDAATARVEARAAETIHADRQRLAEIDPLLWGPLDSQEHDPAKCETLLSERKQVEARLLSAERRR